MANTKEEDPTGLLNEGMRYRDLETGTFITRDPAGFVDGPNLYAYVRQNPWSSFDPERLEAFGYSTDIKNETDTFPVFGLSFTLGGPDTNYRAGWLNDPWGTKANATLPRPVPTSVAEIIEDTVGDIKDIPKQLSNNFSHPLKALERSLDDLMNYSGNPVSSGGRAVLKASAAVTDEAKAAAPLIATSIGKLKKSVHHIMTNKNWISEARRGPWSPRFADMAKKAGMTLEEAANKIVIAGHKGPHPLTAC